jgi:tRNA (cytidine/uridine-2'-O-)-methyltransferase
MCAVTGLELHLVKPLGFATDDAHLKRAGLDYWHILKLHYHDNFAAVLASYPNSRFHYFTSKAPHCYSDVSYGPEDFLVFGKETKGIPEDILADHWQDCVRIPMLDIHEARCLNLSSAAAVGAYEALRQQGFAGLGEEGRGLGVPH